MGPKRTVTTSMLLSEILELLIAANPAVEFDIPKGIIVYADTLYWSYEDERDREYIDTLAGRLYIQRPIDAGIEVRGQCQISPDPGHG